MIDILDVQPGSSYACKFRVTTMLDELGRPAPNLSDVPLKGAGVYESFGLIKQRDTQQELVVVVDESTNREFVVEFANLWDIDTVEWQDG